MTTFHLSALDTLFFRDGRPFNQDDPTQAETRSLFPPHPPTVVGAVRAACATALGWPAQPWNRDALGDGTDWHRDAEPLGPLRFGAPCLLFGDEPVFTAPLHVVRVGKQGPFQMLFPAKDALTSDIGDARLPGAKGEDLKLLDGHWLALPQMERVLRGLPPESTLARSALFEHEPRIGIRREETRTTGEQGMFAAAHVRLCRRLTLAVDIEGAPEFGECRLAPLGGEGRSAWLEVRAQAIPVPSAPTLVPDTDDVLRYVVVHVSPADLGERWPRCGERLSSEVPGMVVSACTSRPLPIGGWDSQARRPLPLRPCIAAGSVWFMEAKSDEVPAVQAWHGRALGASTAWGFGRVLIGRWPRDWEES